MSGKTERTSTAKCPALQSNLLHKILHSPVSIKFRLGRVIRIGRFLFCFFYVGSVSVLFTVGFHHVSVRSVRTQQLLAGHLNSYDPFCNILTETGKLPEMGHHSVVTGAPAATDVATKLAGQVSAVDLRVQMFRRSAWGLQFSRSNFFFTFLSKCSNMCGFLYSDVIQDFTSPFSTKFADPLVFHNFV